MVKRYNKFTLLIVLVVAISILLTGCVPTKYETKPDFAITQQVSLGFIESYSQGEIEKAMEYVAEKATLSADGELLKGKDNIEAMITHNYEKDNRVEVLEQNKIDNSMIEFIVANQIPLFQIAGIDVIKTKERFEVQDGKIVRWKIDHLKESVDMIEKVAVGSTALEVEVQDGQMVVTQVMDNSLAKTMGIQKDDVIVSIDGVRYEDMKYGEAEIPYRLIGEVGSRVELKVSRASEVSVINLRRVHINDL